MESKLCPFEKLGGEIAIGEMIDRFYYKVLFDKLLRGAFLHADMGRVRSM
jgi:truncated hemoglobin YjbI